MLSVVPEEFAWREVAPVDPAGGICSFNDFRKLLAKENFPGVFSVLILMGVEVADVSEGASEAVELLLIVTLRLWLFVAIAGGDERMLCAVWCNCAVAVVGVVAVILLLVVVVMLFVLCFITLIAFNAARGVPAILLVLVRWLPKTDCAVLESGEGFELLLKC